MVALAGNTVPAPNPSISDNNSIGPVLVGASGTETITVSNTAESNAEPFNLQGIVLTPNDEAGDEIGEFFVAATSLGTITGQASRAQIIAFAPVNRGEESASVRADLQNLTDPITTVTATGVAPQRDVTVNGETLASQSTSTVLDLGLTRLGGDTATGNIIIANDGNGFRDTSQRLGVGGSGNTLGGSDDGRALHGQVGAAGDGRVAVGGVSSFALGDAFESSLSDSETLTVTFTPSSTATLSDTLMLNFDNGSGDGRNSAESIAVTITSTVLAPEFAVVDGALSTGGNDFVLELENPAFGQDPQHDIVISNALDLAALGVDPADAGALDDLTITGLSIAALHPQDYTILVDLDGTGGSAGFDTLATLGGSFALDPQDEAVIRIIMDRETAKTDDLLLSVQTDQGATIGGDGAEFLFAIDGSSVAIPLPAALPIMSLGLLSLIMRRRALLV